jgi:dTDP-glucose 4,6-dehydratase
MDSGNILVTGGAGFIGSNFVRFLLKSEPQVQIINVDKLTYAGRLENLQDLPDPQRHILIHGDIGDSELVDEVLRKYRIDTVIHFAAETHVDRSIIEPEIFVKTNILGTLKLLNAASNYWLKEKTLGRREVRFHHISTDEVFGSLGPDEKAWAESAPYAPHSPYAASKAASDHLVRAFGHTHGLPYTLTNCSNNYGPHQFPEKLIPLTILNAVEGKPLPIYGDGKQIRDWLYVEDHCEAIWLVMKHGKVGQTYNIGGGSQLTNLEIVEKLCDFIDQLQPGSLYKPHRQLVTFVADRPGHDRRYGIDCRKIHRELGWESIHSLESGLKKTIEWYLGNTEWVSAIRGEGDAQRGTGRNHEGRRGAK